jgi:RAP domain
MNRMKAQDISNTAWAFAIVGLQHSSFLEAVAAQLERRNRQFTQQEMTNSLWALATLDYRPKGLLHRLEGSILATVCSGKEPLTTRSIAKAWKRQELANMAWVCAVFGEYPTDLIKMIYMGLLGVGDNPDPDVVTGIHMAAALGPDEGISATVIMSLTYLQMMMDLDKSVPRFIRLPDDFPDGWLRISQSGTPPTRDRGTTAQTEALVERRGSGGGDLELNKSVLQQNVGAALGRIGFEHVDEFVLDISTLSRDYGILGGSAMSSEILSLDMANPKQRVGIEVDGPGHFVTNIDNFRGQETGIYQESKIYENTSSSSEKVDIVFGWNGKSSRLVTKINGPTGLKLRIFQAIGWEIHNIPFWEWQSIQGDEKAEDDYCRSLVNSKKR